MVFSPSLCLPNTNWINLTQLEQIAVLCAQFKSYSLAGTRFCVPSLGHMAFISLSGPWFLLHTFERSQLKRVWWPQMPLCLLMYPEATLSCFETPLNTRRLLVIASHTKCHLYWTASDFTETDTPQRRSPSKRTFIWELKKNAKVAKVYCSNKCVHTHKSNFPGCGCHYPFDKLRKVVTTPHVTLLLGWAVNSALLIFPTVFFALISCTAKTRTQGFVHVRLVRYCQTVSSARIL